MVNGTSGVFPLAPLWRNAHHKRMSTLQKSELRSQLRALRRGLSRAQQQRASLALDKRLRRIKRLQRGSTIALYLPNDGEISPLPSLHRLSRQGHRCYLPCIHGKTLTFRHFRPGQKLVPNRFGIPEPATRRGNSLPVGQLSLLCLPLVGFDERGNRLGMGGGFYDRTLATLPPQRRPLLVGLAHELQRVTALPVQSWDIPLDAIVTDRRVYRLKTLRS